MAELENLDIKLAAKQTDLPEMENDTLVFVREKQIIVTADITLALDHAEQFLIVDSSSAIVVTIPTNAAVSFPIGTEIPILRKDTGTVTVATATGVTFNGVSGVKQLEGQWCRAALRKIGTDEWTVSFVKAEALFIAGTLTLATGDWSGNTATKTIIGLTTNDDMVAYITSGNAEAISKGVEGVQDGGDIVFTADSTPIEDIVYKYHIYKGVNA